MRSRSLLLAALSAAAVTRAASGAELDSARVQELERQLGAAQARVAELEATLRTLAADVEALKVGAAPAAIEAAATASPRRDEILVSDLGGDERGAPLTGRPGLFVQTGYAANRIDGATRNDAPTNFLLHRLEARWSGRVAERVGTGFEIQYHPSADGASEELVNDAFIEYYANDALTLRVGQFVTPFGFDVQHSSSARESPERAIFAGYFFPGQRDRGAMLAADLSGLGMAFGGTTFYGGVFNGNRFFDDNDDSLNVALRMRKVFPSRPFALGASWQRGSQLLPPGIGGDDATSVYGVDAQWVFGRLGIRGEYARGDMPSTLLGLEPEFVAGYEPGAKTWGAAAFFGYELTANDELYWRWDRLDDDPVTRANIRAFNLGYLRRIGDNSRLGFDYQWKDDVTFNDDEVNTRFAIRWNLVY